MKTIIKKVNISRRDLIKETKEERLERVNTAGSDMRTRIIPNKKKYNRKRQRRMDISGD